MKRRSLFKSIAAVAGFNLLARGFSVTENSKSFVLTEDVTISFENVDDCLQLNEVFKEAAIKIDFMIHDRITKQSNAYWGRIPTERSTAFWDNRP